MLAPWLCSLDLGQVSDFSALAIGQRTLQQWGNHAEQHYAIRHLERFPLGTPYGGLCLHGVQPHTPCAACPGGVSIGGIVEQVQARIDKLPVPHGWYTQYAHVGPLQKVQIHSRPWRLLLDCTGVGMAVADMFQALEYWPVRIVITSGFSALEAARDEWHVAKRQLVSPFQVAIQTRRVHIAPITLNGVRMDRELVKEALTFQYKLSETTGDDQYGAWRQGTHDDLLLATMMLVWYGEKERPLPVLNRSEQQMYANSEWHPLFPARSA